MESAAAPVELTALRAEVESAAANARVLFRCAGDEFEHLTLTSNARGEKTESWQKFFAVGANLGDREATFAAVVRALESESDLREYIRKDLESRIGEQVRQAMAGQVYKYLEDKTSFELPPRLSERQADRVLVRHMVELYRQGMPQAEVDKRIDEIKTSSRELAARETRMKRELAVRRVGRPGHRCSARVQCRGPHCKGGQQHQDACAAARVHAYGLENGSMRRSTPSFSTKWW